MVLTKREKIIVLVTAALVVLLLFDRYLVVPYVAMSGQLTRRTARARLELTREASLLRNRARIQRAWRQCRAAGLKRDTGAAESAALRALLAYARTADVTIESLQPDRTAPSGRFQPIVVRVAGRGTTATVALFMWRIETAGLPLRILAVQLVPHKLGTDDLTFQMRVATLALTPGTKAQTAGEVP